MNNITPQISDQMFDWFQKALEWETNGESQKIIKLIKARYCQQSKHHQTFSTKISKSGISNK